MASFIVRIELHGPNKNYTELHTWMRKAGFKTTITGSNGQDYHLPTATYRYEGDISAAGLRDWLGTEMPAFGSNPAPWILVSQTTSNAWKNLPAV